MPRKMFFANVARSLHLTVLKGHPWAYSLNKLTGSTNYSDKTKLLWGHAATHYHQSAVMDASFFMQLYHTGDVADVAIAVQQLLVETKKYLEAVVSAIHLCGLQNIS